MSHVSLVCPGSPPSRSQVYRSLSLVEAAASRKPERPTGWGFVNDRVAINVARTSEPGHPIQRPSFSRTRLPGTVSLAAPAMSFKLTMGMSPF